MEKPYTLDTLIENIEHKYQAEPLMLFLNGECILQKSDFLLNCTEHELHISILKNTSTPKPVHIIHILDAPKTILATRIYGLENARATIFETYYLLGASDPKTEQVYTNIYLSARTHLQHYLLCESSATNTLVHTLSVNQQQDSEYNGTLLQNNLGHQETRVSLNLYQPGATAKLQALSLASKTQSKSLNLCAEHHAHNCNSDMKVRGIVNDKAKNHFTGTIIVHPNASQSDAHLEVKQLLLSEQAEAHAKPELEIHNDEVKCTHGATVGHLDTEALFYLTTRGIPEAEAKKLLIQAFMHPVLEHIPAHECLNTIQMTHGY